MAIAATTRCSCEVGLFKSAAACFGICRKSGVHANAELYQLDVDLLLVSITVVIIFTLFMHRFVNEADQKPGSSFSPRWKRGICSQSLNRRSVRSTEFAYLYTRFVKWLSLNMLIDPRHIKQKILTQRAELKRLQAQIKPHFPICSFFIINTLTNGGRKSGEISTKSSGECYRYLTIPRTLFLFVRGGGACAHIPAFKPCVFKESRSGFQSIPGRIRTISVRGLSYSRLIENAL